MLQLIESRFLPAANIIRLRLSDGLFSYANCAVSLEAGERLESEGFKDSHGIIQVTEFVRSITGLVILSTHSFMIILSKHDDILSKHVFKLIVILCSHRI